MTAKRKTTKRAAGDLRFETVGNAFARDRRVSQEKGKGFGSGALKVKGKIFAMMSSKGQFVVKLPKQRVDELVSDGVGERFAPGPGRVMKEWAVVKAAKADWVELAKEAFDFVARSRV